MVKDPVKIKYEIDEAILAVGSVGLQNSPFIGIFSTDWVTTQMVFNRFYF